MVAKDQEMAPRIEIEEYRDDLEEFVTRRIYYSFSIRSYLNFSDKGMDIILDAVSKEETIARMIYNNHFNDSDCIKIFGSITIPKPHSSAAYGRWLVYKE